MRRANPVFALWTDPAHLATRWGPAGFSATTSAFDPRVRTLARPGGHLATLRS
jgi:uncharacterized protein YndB with AHSA1/START domain